MPLPVVFLPGVMGSRLAWQDGSDRFWDPDNKLRTLYWVALGAGRGERLARALHHLVPANVMTFALSLNPRQLQRGWAGAVGSCYYSLLTAMEQAGHDVYVVGYDWRQDLLSLPPYLDRQLAQMGITGPFLLVTHSMGGLLARASFADPQRGPALAARVQGVIHVCQPCHGAAVLYRRMFTGCTSSLDGGGLVDRLFCQILGTSGPQFVINLSGTPGPLQLLPTAEHEYPANHRLAGHVGDPDGFVTDLYGHPISPPGIRPAKASAFVARNLMASLSCVAAFQRQVRSRFHERTWFLYGTGLMTDVAVFFAGASYAPTRLLQGDGTVPEFSAAPSALSPVALPVLAGDPHQYRFAHQDALNHSEACNHPNVANAVLAILNHLNASPAPPGPSTTPTQKFSGS